MSSRYDADPGEVRPLVAAPSRAGSPTTCCNENHRPGQPAERSDPDKAIELLEKDEDGFFLQG